MVERLRRSNKRLRPLAGEQLPLPLDWTSQAGNEGSVNDVAALMSEVRHVCPGCGENLQRKKGCWSCDGCGYSSCREGE
jgi:hypothetical protein